MDHKGAERGSQILVKLQMGYLDIPCLILMIHDCPSIYKEVYHRNIFVKEYVPQ